MGALNEPIRRPLTLDVSDLPSVAFGHRNTTWLANVFYMAIEGMMFALMFATYFYLRTRSTAWPPGALTTSFKIRCSQRSHFPLEYHSGLDSEETRS